MKPKQGRDIERSSIDEGAKAYIERCTEAIVDAYSLQELEQIVEVRVPIKVQSPRCTPCKASVQVSISGVSV